MFIKNHKEYVYKKQVRNETLGRILRTSVKSSFSRIIGHSDFNPPEAYLEPSRTFTMDLFYKKDFRQGSKFSSVFLLSFTPRKAATKPRATF